MFKRNISFYEKKEKSLQKNKPMGLFLLRRKEKFILWVFEKEIFYN